MPRRLSIDTRTTLLDALPEQLDVTGAKKGCELGNFGTAAAIGNADYHATGIRVRDLPISLDKLVH